MSRIIVRHDTGILRGAIHLEGSKSIANRVMIIRALCSDTFEIGNLPACDDTRVMEEVFSGTGSHNHHMRLAGTAGRFLTAYFAFQPDTQVLDAADGLRARPMAPLLTVLRELGCNIDSLHGDDRFPLICRPFSGQVKREISISENISSQFVSALLLLAPTLPLGLKIHFPKDQKSMAYIRMTLEVMKYFGVDVAAGIGYLDVQPQKYVGRDIQIEGDWSSASYFFGMAALAKEANIKIFGLHENSWQGDSVITTAVSSLGVKAIFQDGFLQLQKQEVTGIPPFLDWNFSDCPDLFQTLSATTAGLDVKGVFTGLETLEYKETNRLNAMKNELAKCGVFLNEMPKKFSPRSGKQVFLLQGDYIQPKPDAIFHTYGDHRMAMALSILALKGPISIENPEVVSKSYPGFWEDLKKLGFVMQ